MGRHQLLFTEQAVKDLRRLPKEITRRIDKKLEFYCNQKEPLYFAKALQNSTFGSYRFRIGDYRVIFDIDASGAIIILLILSVKHRREVYRDL